MTWQLVHLTYPSTMSRPMTYATPPKENSSGPAGGAYKRSKPCGVLWWALVVVPAEDAETATWPAKGGEPLRTTLATFDSAEEAEEERQRVLGQGLATDPECLHRELHEGNKAKLTWWCDEHAYADATRPAETAALALWDEQLAGYELDATT